jgi:hypothetical protein
VSQLVRDYELQNRLWSAQSAATQEFLDRQAGEIAAALHGIGGRLRFQLPELVVLDGGENVILPQASRRPDRFGGLRAFFARTAKLESLVRTLDRLEQGLNPAHAACATLLRHATARHLLYDLVLEEQAAVRPADDGDDPSALRVERSRILAPAMASVGGPVDALASQGPSRTGFRVRYEAASPRRTLPERAAFDQDGRPLAGSVQEAERLIGSLQQALGWLAEAVAISPSVAADPTYQRKRAVLRGQLIEQGRALGIHYAGEIAVKIRRRAEAGSLDRGLRLSLPYFDDDEMALKLHEMEVIPGGRIVFLPAFVVRAVQQERLRVSRSLRITPSTRQHLLSLLAIIEAAFAVPPVEG